MRLCLVELNHLLRVCQNLGKVPEQTSERRDSPVSHHTASHVRVMSCQFNHLLCHF